MIGRTMRSSEPLAVPMIGSQHILRSQHAQRSSRSLSDFRCAAIRSAVVWRAKRSQLCLPPYWNKGERTKIIGGDLPNPGTYACGDVKRDKPPKVQVVEPAAPFQPVHHIARVDVRRFYQISKTRWTD